VVFLAATRHRPHACQYGQRHPSNPRKTHEPPTQPLAHRRRHQVRNDESPMHPAMSYDLAQAHVADLHDRAQRDTLARAARLARRNHRGRAPSRLGAWGRRAQAGLIARMTRGHRRRRDSRAARTQRPVPTRIGTCYQTRAGSRPPDPNSGRVGDRYALIPCAARTPEEGHAHNPD
jgi:hypothetical protein